jgi:prepilin-type N-terminal cleavage/methylation domain-containing protein
MKQERLKRQAGFTILELMIATTIVAVILLLATSVMIGLQNLYYKGINQENTQNGVRTIVDQINQDIQTSIGSPAVSWVPAASLPAPVTQTFNGHAEQYQVNALCIGSTRYVYVVGPQVGNNSNQVPQALWRDSTPEAGCASAIPNIGPGQPAPSDGGTAYVTAGSRLTDFKITQLSDSDYQVQVSIALGTDDLLSSNNTYSATCNPGSGGQFCATAGLTSEVSQRLQ